MTLALRAQPDIRVVGQGASANDGIRIVQESNLDVIILDVGVLGRNMDVVSAILEHSPRTGILMLAESVDEEHVYSALRRGVRGYLLKGTSSVELVQTIRVLDQGQSFISPHLAAKLLMRSAPVRNHEVKPEGQLPHLSPRERQILSILV